MEHRTQLPEGEHMAIVAFYDPASGQILHWHYAIADAQSELPGPGALEKQGLEHAARHANEERRVQLQKSSSLHVDRDSLKSGAPYRVDTDRRVVVEVRGSE